MRAGRLAIFGTLSAVGICVALGLRAGMPIWRQQAIVRDIEDRGGFVGIRTPEWIGRHLSEETLAALESIDNGWLFGVTDAILYRARVDDVWFKCLRDLPRLRLLSIAETQITDAGLVHLADLSELEIIFFGDTAITGSGFAALQGLTKLKWLEFQGDRISNDGLAAVALLKGLQDLHLDGTEVTDEGLKHLCGSSSIKYVSLYDHNFTDAGLLNLRRLPTLKAVELVRTRVTDSGISEFRTLRPDVTIRCDGREWLPGQADCRSCFQSLED